MAHVEEHLQLSELEGRYRSASEATEARHFQVIWLSAKGHTVREVSEMTSFGQRWLEQLLSRYNKLGPSSLGDRRRSNGSEATILKPEVLAVLKERLKKPAADGGLWSGPKVAAWTLLTKVETSCDRILIAGGANVEAEWEQGPAV